jgi:hypothetical protein
MYLVKRKVGKEEKEEKVEEKPRGRSGKPKNTNTQKIQNTKKQESQQQKKKKKKIALLQLAINGR